MNITFDDVSFKYIERKILDHASFSITDLDKVGIVGVNGTGKTTMLKLIMKEEMPNSGSIIISGGMRINYLKQDPIFDENKDLLSIVAIDDACKTDISPVPITDSPVNIFLLPEKSKFIDMILLTDFLFPSLLSKKLYVLSISL
jgi:energy-coupling factor transporter ATP-binding protein EcfA2